MLVTLWEGPIEEGVSVVHSDNDWVMAMECGDRWNGFVGLS